MRILKWLGGILVVLILVFLGVGIITPNFSYENKVTVKAPVERAYSVFVDESNVNKWMPTLRKIENVSGAPLEVGSKWKLIFDEEGETIEVLEEMTAIDTNERFAFNLDTEPFLGTVDIRFTAIDSTTSEIKATTTVDGKNMIWKSVMALSKTMMETRSQEQYEMLKKVIEAN